ncbi:indolepyruvate ferredoxin oxidoreductase family protein [Cupriavidus sp. WKF15]|uniref:indolepyruvate ferredoxin oxidoreductase family protein n=1 Tax=Cupriavidus sp. WKF15 TaxID=3032282 RepID=UPI0023E2C4EB|nr:indolepyruvate ferredoxin oxidoreductase family protein [Cupriavidus sp. WKF15]WER46584.1 indolepyruvate ferredoxin oxidoreductase family protein [Cupriavidus sp. WKF15]
MSVLTSTPVRDISPSAEDTRQSGETSSFTFFNGVQALVRLPLLQQKRDALAGRRTAGFISGYRGSPLGTYDQALWNASVELKAHDIVFQPGLNEELAADAVWGTQQLSYDAKHSKFDGVFGIWYGKGPGVDRSLDALKHANLSGTAALGGVMAVAGDDHVSKSSTLAHQSDQTFIAAGIPVIAPAYVQDILDLGLHAFAMSRFAGIWTGMKTVQEVVESATSVDLDPLRVRIALPEDFRMPDGGIHIRWPDDPLEQEARLMQAKWPAALAYVRANRLNHNVIEGRADRVGIIASGKAFADVRRALLDLGLDDATCRQIGLRLHKVNVPWPLEPQGLREFALGLREVLVVEEKRPIIESQVKDELYHCPPNLRPRVAGKFDLASGDGDVGGEWRHSHAHQDWLLRAPADLTPALIAKAIARRLKQLGVPADIAARMDVRLAIIAAKESALNVPQGTGAQRQPWFCPGCPHNTSTNVPEGSQAMAGIGCHGMAAWMDRATAWAQMGGEGAPWIGQAPFSTRRHMFANLGDGTYNHSGFLAIRQAVSAKANITYKILFNSAVAMTGGQPIDGGLDVASMTRELEAEGVRRIDVVTDAPENYANATRLAPGVKVHHRSELDAVQRELREVEGVTALIYDQVCATKKRRERKRGTRADATQHVFINDLVCEGCGDCSKQSNCVAVQPRETELGRKRQVNQSTCNKDLSCVNGFCPSFVTIEGGSLKQPTKPASAKASPVSLPEPTLPLARSAWGILIAGVGGTGVVTIGQVLGMAAHLEGKGVVTQDTTGMAQMGGATWSHVQIADEPDAIHGACVAMANADLLIGCDAIVAGHKTSLTTLAPSRSFVVLNTHATPTAAFVRNPDWQSPHAECQQMLESVVGKEAVAAFDAESIATRMLGSSVYTNMLLLGHAWQSGRIPLPREAILRAVEMNGVKVKENKAAFELGRRCAHDPAWAQSGDTAAQTITFTRKPSLDALVDTRAKFLTDYQNAAYADRYRVFVAKVRHAEASLNAGTRLSEAVARNLFKLMAYKDEYEVARLHTGRAFLDQIAQTFEGEYRVVHHMAPPLLSRRNAKGELVKRAYGPWVRTAMKALARMRSLRGTPLDLFGYTAERKMERALITRYQATIEEVLAALGKNNLSVAVEIANLPDEIRGFGHVKERHLATALPRLDSLMGQWRTAAGSRSSS